MLYRGADKSLSRPGRIKATATKLYFCKPLKKKKIRFSVQPGLRGSNDLRVGRKMATFQFFFQSGRAKDLSALLYNYITMHSAQNIKMVGRISSSSSCNAQLKYVIHPLSVVFKQVTTPVYCQVRVRNWKALHQLLTVSESSLLPRVCHWSFTYRNLSHFTFNQSSPSEKQTGRWRKKRPSNDVIIPYSDSSVE